MQGPGSFPMWCFITMYVASSIFSSTKGDSCSTGTDGHNGKFTTVPLTGDFRIKLVGTSPVSEYTCYTSSPSAFFPFAFSQPHHNQILYVCTCSLNYLTKYLTVKIHVCV